MEPVVINDAARHLGVSPQRVRNMLAHGQLRGQRVGGVWLIDPTSIPARGRRAGQPLSQRMAWGLVAVANDSRPPGISPSELTRLRNRWDVLLLEDDPIVSLRSIMKRRAQRHILSASDPAGVLADPRLSASGRSDPRSGMADNRLAEGYIAERELPALTFDHLLVEPSIGDPGNVIIYAAPEQPPTPVPWLLVAADLADLGPREVQQARNLIRSHGRPSRRTASAARKVTTKTDATKVVKKTMNTRTLKSSTTRAKP